jgi:23S rRNA pseudouridine1911/1915/1917 synthase
LSSISGRPRGTAAGRHTPSILYEDRNVVVVDKPVGLVVHPAAGNPSGTLVNALL